MDRTGLPVTGTNEGADDASESSAESFVDLFFEHQQASSSAAASTAAHAPPTPVRSSSPTAWEFVMPSPSGEPKPLGPVTEAVPSPQIIHERLPEQPQTLQTPPSPGEPEPPGPPTEAALSPRPMPERLPEQLQPLQSPPSPGEPLQPLQPPLEVPAVDGPLGLMAEQITKLAEQAEEDCSPFLKRGDAMGAWNVCSHAVQDFEALILKHGWPRREETARPAAQIYCIAAAQALTCCPVKDSLVTAMRMAQRAVELDPTNANCLLQRGMVRAMSRDWSRAVPDLQSALRVDPGNETALKELQRVQATFAEWRVKACDHERFEVANAAKEDGNSLFNQGQYRAASLEYLRGLDVFDGVENDSRASQKLRALLCCNAADALLRSSDLEDEMAQAMASAALELEPRNVRALLLRGLALRNAQRWDLARADFHEVLCLDPNNAVAQEELMALDGGQVQPDEGLASIALATGQHLAAQGQFRAAAAAFHRGLRQMENQSFRPVQLRRLLLGGVAESLLRCGEAEEVCSMTCRYLEESPMDVDALRWRSCAYLQSQEFTLAHDDLLEAKRLDPDCKEVQKELKLVEELSLLQRELEMSRQAEGQLFDSMIARARDDRAVGNQLFAAHAHADALEAYLTGVNRFADLEPHHLNVAARELKLALCCSVAQAALLLHDDKNGSKAQLALDASEQALLLDPGNVKALFRRGCVFTRRGSWNLARQDFQAVLVVHPKENRQGEVTIRRFQHLAASELAKIARAH